jgi:hypothetical protein
MWARRVISWFVLIAALLALAFMLLPWQPVVERKIIALLAEKGVSPARMSLDHVGWRGLVMKDVALGEPPITLTALTIAYHPRTLLDGRIEEVMLAGLSIRAVEGDSGWSVDGLQGLLQQKTRDAPAAIPVTKAALQALPFTRISLRDAAVNVAGKKLQGNISANLMLQQTPAAKLTLSSNNTHLSYGDSSITLERMTVELALNDSAAQWDGTWYINTMMGVSEALALPPLQAKGTLKLVADAVALAGTLRSDDETVRVEFSMHYALNDPAKSYVLVKYLRMPLSGGTLATQDVKIILDGKKRPLKFTLALSNIAVDTLLQTLTSNRAKASGAVSGEVPVTLLDDGTLRVGKSVLKAQAPGMIALEPEVIPGDNPQVALVREVMKNLQYNLLALEFAMADDNTLGATLAVEGRNPDVEGGRPIKLTVNLSGDLLDLIVQNVRLMTDPKTFIEQKNHETTP